MRIFCLLWHLTFSLTEGHRESQCSLHLLSKPATPWTRGDTAFVCHLYVSPANTNDTENFLKGCGIINWHSLAPKNDWPLLSIQVDPSVNYVLHSKTNTTFKHWKQKLESFCSLPCSQIKSLTMNPARLSNLCWKSFHSSSPLTLPAFSALNICSSVSGCSDASATFSTGRTRSKTSLSGKLTRHISRYT